MNLLNHKFDGSTITYFFEGDIKLVVKSWGNGSKSWFLNGKLHREDGPAYECPDGAKEWYQNGKLHRLDGPAIEYANGTKQWYQNGSRHRLDGPAIERADGSKYWYIEGKRYSEDAFNQKVKELSNLNRT
jgi:hypothetical protein